MNVTDPPVYTVSGFCEAHHIARSFLYILFRQGRGPRAMKLGRRTFITREAAAEWRARMERETLPNGAVQTQISAPDAETAME